MGTSWERRWILRESCIALGLCAALLWCVVGIGARASEQAPDPSPAAGAGSPSDAAPDTPSSRPSGKRPLAFVENKGQTDKSVRFYLRGPRGTIYFTPSEVVFQFTAPAKTTPERRDDEDDTQQHLAAPKTVEGVVVRLSFPGSNRTPKLEGLDELPSKVHHLRGSDPTEWRTNIRSFRGVIYRNLYPGIDLVYRGDTGQLVRTVCLRDDGNLSVVQMRYAGVESLKTMADGSLELRTVIGAIRENRIGIRTAEEPGAAQQFALYRIQEEGLVTLAQGAELHASEGAVIGVGEEP